MIDKSTRAILKDAVENCERSGGCALERLAAHHGHRALVSLSDVAVKYGFTEHEAGGIMDGWDSVRCGRPIGIFHADYHGPDFGDGIRYADFVAEYDAGRQLGEELAKADLVSQEGAE